MRQVLTGISIKNCNGSTRMIERCMLIIIEIGIIGGIATISHRHAKANNKYMGIEFVPTKESKFISYLRANNLYSGFKWMTDDELDDWSHLSCTLEVDLEYHEDIHNLHNDYLFAGKLVKIGNVEKLIPNLNKKTNYVVHYENLKLYESVRYKLQRFIEVLNSKKVPGWKNTLIQTGSCG